MIVLDTHIWLWWVNQDERLLKPTWRELIETSEDIGISAISCFEVAWLESRQRISLPCPRDEWFHKAIAGSGIELLGVSPDIACRAVALAGRLID